MKLSYVYKEGHGNKQLLIETARRAVVRKADRILFQRTGKVWTLIITGNFTKEQMKGIDEYGQYIRSG